MQDISTLGASVTITGAGLSISDITDFSDDGTPIQVSDLEVAGSSMNINGEMVTWAKANPVEVSLSLIPGSDSDNKITNFLRAIAPGGSMGKVSTNAYISSMVISTPDVTRANLESTRPHRTYTFTNGRMLRGTPGLSSDADGRMISKTYTFVFEKVTSV